MAKPKKTQANQTTPKGANEEPTFLDHVRELRNRFFIVAIMLILAASLGYSWHEQIVHVLLAPLRGEKLVYLTPGGGFDFIFKVSLYFGCLVTIPVFIYQLYRYVSPLMKRASRKFAVFLVGASAVLATIGVAFGYFLAVPAALKFLVSFGGDYIQANLTASSYLNFITLYLLGFALIFQLPLIMLCINAAIGPLKPTQLLKYEGYVVLGAFVVAALITPTPDVVNQLITAAPIIVIYQFGILFVALYNRAHKEKKIVEPQVVAAPKASSQPSRQIFVPEVPQVSAPSTQFQTQLQNVQAQVPRPASVSQAPPAQIKPPQPIVQPVSRPRPSLDGFSSVKQPITRPAPARVVPIQRPTPQLQRPVAARRPLDVRPMQRPMISIDGISSY